ncbi:hypothetical protein EI613_12365 [Azospirillum sp. 412522]|nr:hypothetical protein [Azospirillum sp. 412522]MBY6262696.1 hypothetical protein [Azospirillum sp. 412522]
MSYLEIPRIYFGGEWTVSVATANNLGKLFTPSEDGGTDPKIQKLLNFADVVLEDVLVDNSQPTDQELRQYMAIENRKYGSQTINWNYYGSNTASFQTKVVGVDLGKGFAVDDPLVGKTAGFLHTALCDLNPVGSQTTQMFTDAFLLGDAALPDGGAVPEPHFSRWVWFYRNINPNAVGDTAASGFFETKIPMDNAAWEALSALKSPAVDQLRALAAKTGAVGLSVRYCLYLTTSQGIPQVGNYVKKVGKVVGAIGLLGAGELYSYPVGRRLRGATVKIPMTIDYPKQPKVKTVPLAPALINVDGGARRISLDLVTALPEDGLDGTKVDLGTLTLVLNTNGTIATVGVLNYVDYAQPSYAKTSGIVDFDYRAGSDVEAALPDGDFQLWSSKYGVIFTEADALETDQRDTYLHQEEKETIKVKVTRRGRPLAGAAVYIKQYIITDNDESGVVEAKPDERLVDAPDKVEVMADGYASIDITAVKTGQCGIGFFLNKDAGATLDILNDGCGFVRILKVDDYSHITDDQLLGQSGFSIMYENVLRYFYVAYPVMQGIVDFSNYNIMTSRMVLQQLQTLTSKDKWRDFDYMPRTRELTDARRDLLHRWCQVNTKALYPTATV